MSSNNDSTPYLHRLANELKGQEGPQRVVLPNRRSLFVLQELLGKQSDVDVMTIDDLMQGLSGLKLIEPEELLVSFYAAYCKQEKEPQSFDTFTSWAVTFLGDVNDMDLHLGDVDEIYHHIDEYHRTGEAFDPEARGPIEHSFLSFWQRLPGYYTVLVKALDQLKLGYRGRIYRTVAERALKDDSTLLEAFSEVQVHWVGIVPGNPSERALLDYLNSSNIDLTIYADIDRYYSRSGHHEAGRLFREYPLTTDVKWETDVLSHAPKEMTVHPLPGTVVQVTRAKEILVQLGDEAWSRSVIVLPDTSFVAPLIKVFEEEKDRINITSGYPMRNTMIHRFVMTWMNLHANAIDRKGVRYFYHKHLEEFLGYAIVKTWLSGSIDYDRLRNKIVDENVRFVSEHVLEGEMEGDMFGQKAFDLLFHWEEDPNMIFQKISNVLTEWGTQSGKLSMARIEQRAIKTYVEKLKLLLSQFNELLPESDVRALKRFVHRQIGYTKLYLEEPNNDALQIMGMLETRMIDFDHVIVLGAADDKLPGPIRETTHIPYIHRVHFKLPSRKETEALIAYHFYRLITRAKQVHLIFDAIGDEMSSGEPSRYILQLQEELLRINPDVKWKEQGENFTVEASDLAQLKIDKSDAVLEGIGALFQKGLSPSAINTFINSPLEFYFYYVLGVKEQDEVEEDIEYSTFGSYVHEVIEDAYRPFIGSSVDTKKLEGFLDRSDEEVENAFLQKFHEEDLKTGRNLLMLEMAKDHVRRFIQYDVDDMRANGVVKLLYLEEHLATEIDVGDVKVRIKGFADRIDERHGEVRIIDYKSGMTKRSDVYYDPERLPTDRKLSKAMQLALYKFIYCTNHRLQDDQVGSYIFSMRNFGDGYIPLKPAKNVDETVMECMPDVIYRIIQDILDPTQPFEHRQDSAYTTF